MPRECPWVTSMEGGAVESGVLDVQQVAGGCMERPTPYGTWVWKGL